MRYKKALVIDIDGVLVPYPEHFENYVYSLLNIRYKLGDIKKLPQYHTLKYSYRISNIKRTLPLLNDNIPAILNKLKKKYAIWIVSTRPMEVSGMDTIAWLKTNNIYYDELFFVNDKVNFVGAIKENIFAIIDDDEDNLSVCKNSKVVTIRIKKPSDWQHLPIA
jgi:uncharacterized HAD superfamily protein